MKSPIDLRASSRASRYGEIADTSTTVPLRVRSLETNAMRRMFSSRSDLLNPRSLQRCLRMTSPSITSMGRPYASNSVATARQMVVLPAPLRPVNHTVTPLCSTRERWQQIRPCASSVRNGNGFNDHAGGHRVVGHRVDQDEASGSAIPLIRITKDRRVEFKLSLANFVELQGCRPDVPRRASTSSTWLRRLTRATTVLVVCLMK